MLGRKHTIDRDSIPARHTRKGFLQTSVYQVWYNGTQLLFAAYTIFSDHNKKDAYAGQLYT
jgi:hypothetical protein